MNVGNPGNACVFKQVIHKGSAQATTCVIGIHIEKSNVAGVGKISEADRPIRSVGSDDGVPAIDVDLVQHCGIRRDG